MAGRFGALMEDRLRVAIEETVIDPATVEELRSLQTMVDSLCETVGALARENQAMTAALVTEIETRRAVCNRLTDDVLEVTAAVRGLR